MLKVFFLFSRGEKQKNRSEMICFLVGARGFEPPTSCTPCKRASRAAPRPDTTWVLVFEPTFPILPPFFQNSKTNFKIHAATF
jgi:hypothetical protein